MNKIKLQYEIHREGKTVFFRVLKMNEELRGIVNFKSKTGLWVCSKYGPLLTKETIMLRGNFSYRDFERDFLLFNSEKQAEEFISTVHETLKDWAENDNCFNNISTEILENNIFTV